jgi:hypothetical protein
MADASRGSLASVVDMHPKRLEATVVKNCDHDVAARGEGPADLDLSVVAFEAAAELEDPTGPRRATGVELRALTQLAVGGLGARSLGLDPGHEETGHLRRAFGATAG